MLRFWGHSDDCAEVDGDIRDEIGCHGDGARFRIGTPSGGLIVTMGYGDGDGAVWWHRVAPIDEGIPVPWPIRFEPKHEYSMALVVDCPSGTPLTVSVGSDGKWTDERPVPLP